MLFEEACEKAFGLKNVSDKDKLILYGLYKQATVGDCNTSCPFWFTRKMMWEAWFGYSGLEKKVAKMMYVDKIRKLSN